MPGDGYVEGVEVREGYGLTPLPSGGLSLDDDWNSGGFYSPLVNVGAPRAGGDTMITPVFDFTAPGVPYLNDTGHIIEAGLFNALFDITQVNPWTVANGHVRAILIDTIDYFYGPVNGVDTNFRKIVHTTFSVPADLLPFDFASLNKDFILGVDATGTLGVTLGLVRLLKP